MFIVFCMQPLQKETYNFSTRHMWILPVQTPSRMQDTTSEAEDEEAGGVKGSDDSSEESDASSAGHVAKPSEPEAPKGNGDSSIVEGGEVTSNPKETMLSADGSPEDKARQDTEMKPCEKSTPEVHDATGPKDSAGKPEESTPALASEAKQPQVEPVNTTATSKDDTGSECIFARKKYIAMFIDFSKNDSIPFSLKSVGVVQSLL